MSWNSSFKASPTINFAVSHSNRYIPDRFLPDKAIDLLDEAGARVKLRQATVPEEVSEVQKRVKFITHRMESAIAAHEFEKARFYSEEERKEKIPEEELWGEAALHCFCQLPKIVVQRDTRQQKDGECKQRDEAGAQQCGHASLAISLP